MVGAANVLSDHYVKRKTLRRDAAEVTFDGIIVALAVCQNAAGNGLPSGAEFGNNVYLKVRRVPLQDRVWEIPMANRTAQLANHTMWREDPLRAGLRGVTCV